MKSCNAGDRRQETGLPVTCGRFFWVTLPRNNGTSIMASLAEYKRWMGLNVSY